MHSNMAEQRATRKKSNFQLSQVTSSQKSWSCTSLKDSIYEFFLWTNIDQHPWHWKNWNERLEIKEKLWLFRGFSETLPAFCAWLAASRPRSHRMKLGTLECRNVKPFHHQKERLSGLDSREWGCLKSWIDVTRKSMDFMVGVGHGILRHGRVVHVFENTHQTRFGFTIVRTSKPAAFSCCSASWLPNLSYFHGKDPEILKLSK